MPPLPGVLISQEVASQLVARLLRFSERRREFVCRCCATPTGYHDSWLHSREDCPVHRLQLALDAARRQTPPPAGTHRVGCICEECEAARVRDAWDPRMGQK